MLNQKENAFKLYMKAMLDAMEEGNYVKMPNGLGNYEVVMGTNRTGIFIKDNQVLDPLTWLKSICADFGHTLAGMAESQTELPIIKTLETKCIEIDPYNDQMEYIVKFISSFTNSEVSSNYQDGVFEVYLETEFLAMDEDGEAQKFSSIAYEFPVNEDSELDDDFDEEEDFEDEDEIVEREDLIISGSSVTLSGTFEDSNKVTFNDPHKDIAHEVASLVSEKQKAYGNSVDKVQRVIEIMMEQYDNGDGTYTIPKELIPHLLYQVRIMDKQNRIFTNPEADLMDESPYTDILGYALLMLAKLKEEN